MTRRLRREDTSQERHRQRANGPGEHFRARVKTGPAHFFPQQLILYEV